MIKIITRNQLGGWGAEVLKAYELAARKAVEIDRRHLLACDRVFGECDIVLRLELRAVAGYLVGLLSDYHVLALYGSHHVFVLVLRECGYGNRCQE